MLSLSNAAVGYGRIPLISCINLEIQTGDIVFLLGANGSGKSTLAKSLVGVLPLVAGTRQSDFERIAYVPQSSYFETQYPLTVQALVAQGLPAQGLLRALAPAAYRERQQLSSAVLAEVGIASCAQSLLRELSGGQLQRALIARALVGRPDFLLLDEPFSNLDRSGRCEIARILRNCAQQGTTICVIDHGDAIEPGFYNRLLEIENGHLVEQARRN